MALSSTQPGTIALLTTLALSACGGGHGIPIDAAIDRGQDNAAGAGGAGGGAGGGGGAGAGGGGSDGAVDQDGSGGVDGGDRAAASDAAPEMSPDVMGSCALATGWEYWNDGGFRAYADRVRLAPPRTCRITRTALSPGTMTSCEATIPDCGGGDALDVGDVNAILAHPDVLAALAMAKPPLYGYDSRPFDGSVFALLRDDGRGFLVGDSCGTRPSCTEPPPGVVTARTILEALEASVREQPACMALGK